MSGRRPALATAGLLALALLIAVWFGIGVRQSTTQNHAEAIIESASRLTAAQARQASRLLDDAGTLNPNRQIELDRSTLMLERGDPVAARDDAAAVIRAEPQNVQAWLTLAYASSRDAPVLASALHHVAELEPLIPKS